jgi:tRNA(Arg) A34 adenosine deaminase TadA
MSYPKADISVHAVVIALGNVCKELSWEGMTRWSWWSTTLLKMVIDWNVIKCLDRNDL